jgi:hypothetical protein
MCSGANIAEMVGQDHCASRAEILGVDWWLYLGVPQHLPKLVVFQARV